MNSFRRVPNSFWIGLVLAAPLLLTVVGIVPAIIDAFNQVGLLILPLLSLVVVGLIEPAIGVLILVGLYFRKRPAIFAYMLVAPLGAIYELGVLEQIIFHEDHIGASLGYGAASSLALTAFIAVVLVLTILIEFLAFKDLRRPSSTVVADAGAGNLNSGAQV